MNENGRGILGNRDATGEEIRRAMEHAVFAALREHKRIGNPVAVWDWENDRVAIVPPEQIELPAEYEVKAEAATARDGSALEPDPRVE